MKAVVFSDVHGNLPALEAMLDHAGSCDQYVCLGDNVNYGPWSEECVQLVASLDNCVTILGNHEESFLKKEYLGSHPLPKIFFEYCIRGFKSWHLISDLPTEYRLGDFRFVHTIDGRNIYPDSEVSISENLFIGHSHHQFQRKINGFDLVNVGSVGQNRRYINLINYAVFYPETGLVELRCLPYDVQPVLDEMKRRGFPAECIVYYTNKERWSEAAVFA
jgi:predicted phosphodiesterase